MEKPRKEYLSDGATMCDCDCYKAGKNCMHNAMSTWLEGEVPTVKEIEKVMKKYGGINSNAIFTVDVAKEIHALLTRKLTGKV